MAVSNRSSQKQVRLSTKYIQWAVWFVLILFVLTLAAFSGYYYWDRYVHVGDKSPLEANIEHMEQAIREDPQNPDTRIVLAEYYLNQGMYQEALQQTSQVLNLFPEHEGALLVAGVSYIRMDQPAAALEPLEQFIALRKDRAMANTDTLLEAAYYFVGESYIKLNQPAKAIPALEAALVINHTDADALYQLGLAYQANGQPEAALEAYHRAVRLVPNFSEVYAGMTESYSALNQADYEAYARGMQAFTWQDYQTAQTHLEHATRTQPDFALAFLGLGLTYEKIGDLEAAQAAIHRALELDSTDFAAQQALGRIQASINK